MSNVIVVRPMCSGLEGLLLTIGLNSELIQYLGSKDWIASRRVSKCVYAQITRLLTELVWFMDRIRNGSNFCALVDLCLDDQYVLPKWFRTPRFKLDSEQFPKMSRLKYLCSGKIILILTENIRLQSLEVVYKGEKSTRCISMSDKTLERCQQISAQNFPDTLNCAIFDWIRHGNRTLQNLLLIPRSSNREFVESKNLSREINQCQKLEHLHLESTTEGAIILTGKRLKTVKLKRISPIIQCSLPSLSQVFIESSYTTHLVNWSCLTTLRILDMQLDLRYCGKILIEELPLLERIRITSCLCSISLNQLRSLTHVDISNAIQVSVSCCMNLSNLGLYQVVEAILQKLPNLQHLTAKHIGSHCYCKLETSPDFEWNNLQSFSCDYDSSYPLLCQKVKFLSLRVQYCNFVRLENFSQLQRCELILEHATEYVSIDNCTQLEEVFIKTIQLKSVHLNDLPSLNTVLMKMLPPFSTKFSSSQVPCFLLRTFEEDIYVASSIKKF